MLIEKLKKIIPKQNTLLKNKSLYILGSTINKKQLWHLNRKSISKATIIGLFLAWVPVPFQMVLAAACSVYFNANLPLSIALVWLTNPLTMPPLFFFAYKIGAYCLNIQISYINFNLLSIWQLLTTYNMWKAFLFGCFVCGISSSITGYIIINIIWNYFTVKK